jgi:hypothetical protein
MRIRYGRHCYCQASCLVAYANRAINVRRATSRYLTSSRRPFVEIPERRKQASNEFRFRQNDQEEER